jgi:outer membrane protein TolC
VLTFQDDLAKAQSQHIRAVIDYNKALVNLERARGLMLQTYGVNMTNVDLNPTPKPVVFPVGMN